MKIKKRYIPKNPLSSSQPVVGSKFNFVLVKISKEWLRKRFLQNRFLVERAADRIRTNIPELNSHRLDASFQLFEALVKELLSKALAHSKDSSNSENIYFDVQEFERNRYRFFHEIRVRFQLTDKPVEMTQKPPSGVLTDVPKRPILGLNKHRVESSTYDYVFRVRIGKERSDFDNCKTDFYCFVNNYLDRARTS